MGDRHVHSYCSNGSVVLASSQLVLFLHFLIPLFRFLFLVSLFPILVVTIFSTTGFAEHILHGMY